VYEAARSGAIDRVVPTLRKLYRRKRDVLQAALRAELGDRLDWTIPRGGFFLWARLPEGCDDRALLGLALEQRVVFVVGSAFYVDGTGHDRIRLSFSAPSPDRIREGARRLAEALRQPVSAEGTAR
jgi:2-aminoadipate transaminase